MEFKNLTEELENLHSHYRDNAFRYHEARKRFGDALYALNLFLVKKQKDKKYQKAAIDKQYLMLIEDAEPEAREGIEEYYRDYIKGKQDYKGLEKVLSVVQSRISVLQSLMRWERDND